MKRGKKYQDSVKKIDRAQQYGPADAIKAVCDAAHANFDETVEAHIRLGVDGRHADQQVRGAKLRKPALIMSAARNWFRRSRTRTGSTSMSLSLLRI